MCKLFFVLFPLFSVRSLRPFFLYLFSYFLFSVFSLSLLFSPLPYASPFLSLIFHLCLLSLPFAHSLFIFSIQWDFVGFLSLYSLIGFFLFLFSFSQFSLYSRSSVLPFLSLTVIFLSFSSFPYRRISLRIYFILSPLISSHFFLIFLLFSLFLSFFSSRSILIDIFLCSIFAELPSFFLIILPLVFSWPYLSLVLLFTLFPSSIISLTSFPDVFRCSILFLLFTL